MAEITMCSSINCTERDTCYRSKAIPSDNQSYYNFEYVCNEESAFNEYIKNEVKE